MYEYPRCVRAEMEVAADRVAAEKCRFSADEQTDAAFVVSADFFSLQPLCVSHCTLHVSAGVLRVGSPTLNSIDL